MTAPHRSGHRSEAAGFSAELPAKPADRHRNECVLPARRDNPDAPSKRMRHAVERQPRTYTSPELPTRRKRPRADDAASAGKRKVEALEKTPEELDRWDEEWRDEWERGDVDDSAAYSVAADSDDELDVADQARDVEWLLDALDALDDEGNDDEAFEWEE